MTTPRLGVASIIVSISDKEGFIVRHGSDPDVILASKSPEDCATSDWDRLWDCLLDLGLIQREI